jgi:hypothetical protein
MIVVELGQAKVLFSFGRPVVYFDGHDFHVTATPRNRLTEKHVGEFLASESVDMVFTGKNIKWVSEQFLQSVA